MLSPNPRRTCNLRDCVQVLEPTLLKADIVDTSKRKFSAPLMLFARVFKAPWTSPCRRKSPGACAFHGERCHEGEQVRFFRQHVHPTLREPVEDHVQWRQCASVKQNQTKDMMLCPCYPCLTMPVGPSTRIFHSSYDLWLGLNTPVLVPGLLGNRNHEGRSHCLTPLAFTARSCTGTRVQP